MIQTSEPSRKVNASILVVEDDADLRAAIAELFGGAGWAVTWATDGEDAVAMLRADPPDLIMTDIIMPKLDGLGLVRRIREFDAKTPILILTGYASFDHCVAALRAGANDFLEKPFDNDELLEAAARALAGNHVASCSDILSSGTTLKLEIKIDAALAANVFGSTTTPGGPTSTGSPSSSENQFALELKAQVDAFIVAAGMIRRRLAMHRAVEVAVEQALVARRRSGASLQADLLFSLMAESNDHQCRVRLFSAAGGLDLSREVAVAPGTGEADPHGHAAFLLQSFCDDVAVSQEGRSIELIFHRPRPQRPLRQGA